MTTAKPRYFDILEDLWHQDCSCLQKEWRCRQLYTVHDGGTIALDWLLATDSKDSDGILSEDASAPLVVIVPGLTSDSAAAYVKHMAYSMATKGCNTVVSNHRGLGGVSITSDCLYNAGWTEDLREVINYIHHKYPKAPMLCVGTSIGANIVVKYLGEEGENTPVAGAASICSPWDLVVGDRFISRKLVQRFYDKALAFGLKGYAKLHEPVLVRLANWEVPLLCVNALDDPLCTREAIPWDECRANKNIVLATTPNGGHLAFFQGLTAGRLWWVGAVSEFLFALLDSKYMHQQKAQDHILHSSLESSIDKSPYVNVMEDGMIAPVTDDGPCDDVTPSHQVNDIKQDNGDFTQQNEHTREVDDKNITEVDAMPSQSPEQSAGQQVEEHYVGKFHEAIAPVKRSINQLTRYQGKSVWLLAYIAFVTSWPLLGSLAFIAFRKKFRNNLLAKWLRR
uniref:AB hydrolase-1 domain-containing protein n=1 Tax=Oryza glumipatula TaxID=40148 RepID=A0A0D9YI10_9ORYZ